MQKRRMRVGLVGDVLTRPLGRLFDLVPEIEFDVTHFDIDQHFSVLLQDSSLDILVLHAGADFYFRVKGHEDIGNLANEYFDAVRNFSRKNNCLVVLNTIYHVSDAVVDVDCLAQAKLVSIINDSMIRLALESQNIVVANLSSVIGKFGSDRALSVKNDLVMRFPYTGAVLPAISKEYARLLREKLLPRKKVVVLDADNTLWGGIVGEDGVDGIAVDENYPGLVYRKFQHQLRCLQESGVLLALVSKNNEQDVVAAFAQRDMPLKYSDFSAARVNWMPKSQNIRSIAQELNVGLDSMIFIDDSQFELEEVGGALPDVAVYQFDGKRPDQALALIASVRDITAWSITKEDIDKVALYRQESHRQSLQKESRSIEDYLQSLGIKMEVGCNRQAHVKRISQLTNKTNQFNLTTRRYGETEILDLMHTGKVYDFRVIDRFGDMGIVGVVIVVDDVIDTFLMSCRALGRRVEATMLNYVRHDAGGAPLTAAYVETGKNGMVSEFYESNGFAVVSEDNGHKTYVSRDELSTDILVDIEKVD